VWTQTNYEAAPAAVHEGGQARWERHGQHALLLAAGDSIIEYNPENKREIVAFIGKLQPTLRK